MPGPTIDPEGPGRQAKPLHRVAGQVAPLRFVTAREYQLGALPLLWLTGRMQGVPLTIPTGKAGLVARLAIPNIIGFHLFVIPGVGMMS